MSAKSQAPDRLVVRLDPHHADPEPALRQLLASLPADITVVRDLDRFGRAVLQLPSGTDVAQVVAHLKEQPGVAHAEPLYLDHISN